MLRNLVMGLTVAIPAFARADMYTVSVKAITVQAVDDKDKPTGKVTTVNARPEGTLACNLADDPKSKTYETWRQGNVDDAGKLRMTHSKGGAADDIVSCAGQVVANVKLPVKGGEFKVVTKVSFAKAKM
jgi:hypothetical protein